MKKNIRQYTLLPILLILLVSISADAESLFDPQGVSLITDLRASQIGDIVFIVVNEGTSASSEAKTDGQKDIGIKGGLKVEGFFEDLFGFPPVIEPIQDMNINPSEQFKASGKTSNKDSITTRITATVIDILPNGNLVIEGKRSIKVNEEPEQMVLRGTIRPTDLSTDNTISSTMMADVDIQYSGRGDIAKRQKGGLFTELFNFLF